MRTYKQHTVFLLLMINFLSFVHCDYFECSEDYALDWELYGECIPKNCGRFRVLLDSKNFNIIDDIVKSIESQIDFKNHSVVIADLVSETITKDADITTNYESDFNFRNLTQTLLETIGFQVRGIIQELFDIKSKLWIAR